MHYKRRSIAVIYEEGGGVGKDYIIYMLEMGFTLLNKKNKLMISTISRYAAKGIRRSIIHTALIISTYKANSLCINVSKIWAHQSLLTIDVLSIIQMELFVKIDKQLYKTRGGIVSLITLFDGLPLIILIDDLYSFSPINGCSL